jgi:hypothetical protein
MSPNENWRRLARQGREADASGTAVVAFAVALAVAWSATLIFGLAPDPAPPQLSGPPDADATWPAG